MQQTTISKSPMVDALRGFGLAILLVHNGTFYIRSIGPATLPGWLNVLNEVCLLWYSLCLPGNRILSLPCYLVLPFIYSIRTSRRRERLGYRFFWRLLLLTIFATLNAAFYPAGDVLLLYAIVGVVLFIVRKWSDKAVLITAIIFLLQPVEWYHYIASLFNPDYQLPNLGVGRCTQRWRSTPKRGIYGISSGRT